MLHGMDTAVADDRRVSDARAKSGAAVKSAPALGCDGLRPLNRLPRVFGHETRDGSHLGLSDSWPIRGEIFQNWQSVADTAFVRWSLIVDSHLRSNLAQFKLVAHLLN